MTAMHQGVATSSSGRTWYVWLCISRTAFSTPEQAHAHSWTEQDREADHAGAGCGHDLTASRATVTAQAARTPGHGPAHDAKAKVLR
ncbi:hypothetical protein GCM10010234_10370 [Streptomyces hawaiiensis]|uniref:hypothetical protein n=1 Tax=Streptomyces hawaiiensis TaxID=67305 RepID=UPI0031CE4DDA